MPVSASDLVKKLLTKAGVTYDGDLAELPDDIATSLDNNLLTIAAATNNHPQVKKVYFAQAYNGLDAEIENAMTEFALDDDAKAEIKGEQSSTKKAVALARKIKELESKKADPGKADTYKNQITELHAKLAEEVRKQNDLKTTYEKQIKGIHIQSKLDNLIGSYKTVYDELPVDAKQAAVNSLISKALQDSEAEWTFDEKGNLSLIKKDGTNLFGDNHTQLTPQSFIDKSLSKILKVSEPGGNTNILPPKVVPGAQNTTNTALAASIRESQKAYEQSTKVAV